MLLRLIRNFPLSLVQLVYLLLWLYFCCYQPNFLSVGGFAILFFLFLYRLRGRWRSICFLMACLGLASGFFLYQQLEDQKKLADHELPSQLRLFPDTIKVNGDSLSFRARGPHQTYQVFYQLQSEQEKQTWQGQDQLVDLTFIGSISLPEGQRNFKGFDYQAYLKTQGIFYQIKIEKIQTMRRVHSWDIRELLSEWRRKAIVWVQGAFPTPMSHYMTGLLFGFLDTDFEEMNDLYSSLGIIHLFALSGMQVGFFVNIFSQFFLRIGILKETVAWLLYPFSLVYAGITSFSVSVVRSLLQKLLAQKGISGMNNLALTLLVLMVLMPKFLLTAGGVLSCAYAFILTIIDTSAFQGFKKVLVENIWISLGILPLLTFYFSVYQPWSIPLTYLFSYLFDFLLLPALSALFALSFFLPVTFINPFFVFLESGIRWVAEWASRPLVLASPSGLVLILALFLLAIGYEVRKRKQLAALILVFLGILCFVTKYPLENEITMIDVGQGDSIFLRDRQGRTVLIDVGGRVEIGQKESWQKRRQTSNAEKTVLPYLKSRGVGRLDALVITHTDQDHMGDMMVLAKTIPIKTVYVSKGSLTDLHFLEKLRQLQTDVQILQAGDRLPIFDRYLEVVAPASVGDGGNNDSIVLYGSFYQKRFLFTGDLEEEGEKALLERYPRMKVDVLKAGHHGSKGSTTEPFLDSLDPQLVLISAGKNNRYKHPHQEMMNRLEERNIAYLRTDERGAIRLRGWKDWIVETVQSF